MLDQACFCIFFHFLNLKISEGEKGSEALCVKKRRRLLKGRQQIVITKSRQTIKNCQFKNINKMNVGKLGIHEILTNFKKYKDDGYTMSLCICIRDKKDYDIMNKLE